MSGTEVCFSLEDASIEPVSHSDGVERRWREVSHGERERLRGEAQPSPGAQGAGS